jgi:multiple sugar transport system substrate-binding protein
MIRSRRAKPRLRLASALLIGILIASGCTKSTTSGQPTVLRVLMTDDWITPPFVAAVRDFEQAHPGVLVDFEKGPIANVDDTVQAAIASGNPPDAVQGHAFSGGARGLAQAVDDLWRQQLKDADFFPGAIEDVTWAGHRYGVPLDTNAMVLIYDADHVTGAKIVPPPDQMSFADFANASQAVTTTDGSHKSLAMPTSSWWTYGWVRANGGELVRVGADGAPSFSLDAPPVVGALSYLAGLVSRGDAFPPPGADSHAQDAFAIFRAGGVSFHLSGSWDLTGARSALPTGHFATALMPRGDSTSQTGTAMGGSSLYIPKGSQHRSLAFEFMTNLIADRYALRFAREQGRLPVRVHLFDDPFFQTPDLQVFLEQLKTAHPFLLGAFPNALDAFATATDEILRLGRDPAASLHVAQQRAVESVPPTG